MARLNKNNFLIWEGSFDEAPFEVVANPDTASISETAASVNISPLANDFATYGIDASSFNILTHDNPTNPPIWNATTQTLTYFLPSGQTSGTVTYRFRDTLGNISNIGTITITQTARATMFVGYEPSKVCLKDSNDANTGQAFYNQLIEVYSDNGAAVEPQNIKANQQGEPGYIGPFTDLASCPLPLTSVNYLIINNTSNPLSGRITAISFFDQNGTQTFTQNIDIRPGQNFNVSGPSGTVSISLNVTTNGSAQLGFRMILNNTEILDGSNSQTYEFLLVEISGNSRLEFTYSDPI